MKIKFLIFCFFVARPKTKEGGVSARRLAGRRKRGIQRSVFVGYKNRPPLRGKMAYFWPLASGGPNSLGQKTPA
jgi:hypothetical protein